MLVGSWGAGLGVPGVKWCVSSSSAAASSSWEFGIKKHPSPTESLKVSDGVFNLKSGSVSVLEKRLNSLVKQLKWMSGPHISQRNKYDLLAPVPNNMLGNVGLKA